MKYYLGIDGGGTRTTAAVSDENGNVLFKAVGKSINFYSVGMEKARENLKNDISDIYKNLGQIEFYSAFTHYIADYFRICKFHKQFLSILP